MRHAVCIATVVLSLAVAGPAMADICGLDEAPDPCAGSPDSRQACLTAVEQNPRSVNARLTLCEILVRAGDLESAAIVLRDGLTLCAGNAAACKNKLRVASSIVKEARLSRDQVDPRAAERQRLASKRRCLSSLSTSKSIAACEGLLLTETQDLELYEALVKKLLKEHQPNKALGYILAARRETGDANVLADSLGRVTSQRMPLVEECLAGSSIAACDRAYLAGAEDEHLVLLRKAQLLTDAGRYDAAQEAVASAAALRPNDPGVRQALAKLTRARSPQDSPEAAASSAAPQFRNVIDASGVVH